MRVLLGPLEIDRSEREVRVWGSRVTLSPKEFDLLLLLAERPGAVVDRRRILATVWGPCFAGRAKTVDFHISALRSKLGDPTWIENRRGVGFRLAVPLS